MYEQNADYKVITGKGPLVSGDLFKTVKLAFKSRSILKRRGGKKVQGIPN